MNYGKVSESVFDRTVYKTIQTIGYHDESINKGAGLGADCAIFPFSQGESQGYLVSAQGHAEGKDVLVAVRAIHHALNRMAAAGVFDNGQITLHISMPEKLREAKLRMMLERAAKASAEYKFAIINTQVHIVPQIQTVLAQAFVQAVTVSPVLFPQNARPEQDIVMTKWLGLEATSLITEAKFSELEKRYPLNLLETAKSFERHLSIIPEAATAVLSGVSAMQVMREGGVFGALWELAQSSGVGLVIDLKKIPVKQETIEVCEYFDINPYKMLSGGSLLITTDRGTDLVSNLCRQGISATIIGKTTQGNDRIIMNDDEVRYLEPAREDELYKVLA